MNPVIVFIAVLALGEGDASLAPTGYYDSVDLASAATMRPSLHEVIDDHTRFPYTSTATDTWDILDLADEDPNNAADILDVYRNASFPKAGGGNPNYEREHTWPSSYGFPDDLASNYPYTDCHHLFLSFGSYNASRGNTLYRTCSASCAERETEENNGQGGGICVYPATPTGGPARNPPGPGRPGSDAAVTSPVRSSISTSAMRAAPMA